MADNVTLPLTGTGDATALVATDDAGVDGQVQIVKLALSANGSAVPITADSGGLLVNLGANNDITGTVTANAGTDLNTSLLSTEATLSTLNGKVTAVDTGNVTVVSVPTTTVTATNFDIRDLSSASDSVTVTGTVTANAGTNLNTSLLATEATLSTLNGKVTAVNTGSVTVVSAPTTTVTATNLDIRDLSSVSDSVTVTGTVAATQSGSWSLAANQSVNVAQINGVAPTMGNGGSGTGVQRVTIASDSTGQVALAAGTQTVGNVGLVTRTSGGLTTYHLVSANTTNATVVKGSAGQLYGWYVYNNNAAMRKLAFHNTASAPTAGANIFFTINVPASSAANCFNDMGIAFSSGIAITTVTDVTDAGNTAVGTSDLTINLFYA